MKAKNFRSPASYDTFSISPFFILVRSVLTVVNLLLSVTRAFRMSNNRGTITAGGTSVIWPVCVCLRCWELRCAEGGVAWLHCCMFAATEVDTSTYLGIPRILRVLYVFIEFVGAAFLYSTASAFILRPGVYLGLCVYQPECSIRGGYVSTRKNQAENNTVQFFNCGTAYRAICIAYTIVV